MQNNKTTKAVLYCRIASSKVEHPANALQPQELAGRAWAIKNGYEVVAVFSEQASGMNNSRRQLLSLLSFCTQRENGISAVIVRDRERLSRNMGHLAKILQQLREADVKVMCVNTSNTTPEMLLEPYPFL